jgi:hypothetical protein
VLEGAPALGAGVMGGEGRVVRAAAGVTLRTYWVHSGTGSTSAAGAAGEVSRGGVPTRRVVVVVTTVVSTTSPSPSGAPVVTVAAAGSSGKVSTKAGPAGLVFGAHRNEGSFMLLTDAAGEGGTDGARTEGARDGAWMVGAAGAGAGSGGRRTGTG